MPNLITLFFLIFFGFIIYLIIDHFRKGTNKFFDVWTLRTLWLWLPFYGLWRLVREVFFNKR